MATTKSISPLVEALGLQQHREGGWYREIWKASFEIPHQVLGGDYSGPRFAASSIYFVLHPGEQSAWHTVLSDELWLWHSGSALKLTLGGDGENAGEEQELILGPDVLNGQQPQLLVPARVWQKAEPLGDEPVFVSCVVAPGFHYDDFHMIKD